MEREYETALEFTIDTAAAAPAVTATPAAPAAAAATAAPAAPAATTAATTQLTQVGQQANLRQDSACQAIVGQIQFICRMEMTINHDTSCGLQ